MFTTNRYVRPSGNPSGKMKQMPAPGVQLFSEQSHRGYRYQIGRRVLGLTIKRTTYSATIEHIEGGAAEYLADLPSLAAARQAAEAWIDVQIGGRHTPQLKAWESLLEQTQARQRGSAVTFLGGNVP